MINIYIAHYNHYFFEKSIKDVGDDDDKLDWQLA